MTDEDRKVRNLIVRAAGLDPDGKLVPMQPWVSMDQRFLQLAEESSRYARDHYLCRALRFT
jgi:hypothetical protein